MFHLLIYKGYLLQHDKLTVVVCKLTENALDTWPLQQEMWAVVTNQLAYPTYTVSKHLGTATRKLVGHK